MIRFGGNFFNHISSPARGVNTPSADFVSFNRADPLLHFDKLYAAQKAQRELMHGLTSAQSFLPAKYFYNSLGSRLFEAITELPEYYLTRTESTIFKKYAHQMAQLVGTGSTFIDLGAGNCKKAESLFTTLQPARYVAIDISADFLSRALQGLRCQFPQIAITGLGLDFSTRFTLPPAVSNEKRLFFYPGSSIGNFMPEEALKFLSQIRAHCGQGNGLLIGFDLAKEEAVLSKAYDDELGVTAAFNLNILNHVNELISSDFLIDDWAHRAFYNSDFSRVEMHLEAKRKLIVKWPGGARIFNVGQRIHTENSYKYSLNQLESLLHQAGFDSVTKWVDDKQWFAVCYAKVNNEPT